jgi:hypothetical protein
MKVYEGVEVYLHHSDLGPSMVVSSQHYAQISLPLKKIPRCSLERSLGGPQSRSGRCGKTFYTLHSEPKYTPRYGDN